jgi:uncharacterized membrane protein
MLLSSAVFFYAARDFDLGLNYRVGQSKINDSLFVGLCLLLLLLFLFGLIGILVSCNIISFEIGFLLCMSLYFNLLIVFPVTALTSYVSTLQLQNSSRGRKLFREAKEY